MFIFICVCVCVYVFRGCVSGALEEETAVSAAQLGSHRRRGRGGEGLSILITTTIFH